MRTSKRGPRAVEACAGPQAIVPCPTRPEIHVSETLKALLRYTKVLGADFHWKSVRDQVLAPLYHSHLSMFDVLQLMLGAYTELLMEPRFETPGHMRAAETLVLAPVKGAHSIDLIGPHDLTRQYSVEQFYGAMLRKMLSDMQLSRVDWCRGQIWPEQARAQDLEILRRELAREDLEIYSAVHFARREIERDDPEAAIARLRVDADKIRMHSPELYAVVLRWVPALT
jgi:hypothetical protein